jgi:hypothetical protein
MSRLLNVVPIIWGIGTSGWMLTSALFMSLLAVVVSYFLALALPNAAPRALKVSLATSCAAVGVGTLAAFTALRASREIYEDALANASTGALDTGAFSTGFFAYCSVLALGAFLPAILLLVALGCLLELRARRAISWRHIALGSNAIVAAFIAVMPFARSSAAATSQILRSTAAMAFTPPAEKRIDYEASIAGIESFALAPWGNGAWSMVLFSLAGAGFVLLAARRGLVVSKTSLTASIIWMVVGLAAFLGTRL